jgi:acyl carrier protein
LESHARDNRTSPTYDEFLALAATFAEGELDSARGLFDQPSLDSVAAVEFLCDLEETYNLELDETIVEQIEAASVVELYAVLVRLMAPPATP